MSSGWIKIHRSILDWEWYHDTNVFRLFTHLLLTVNYEDKKWQGQTIKRGEIITSYAKLAEQTNLSTQEVRTALRKLISTGEISKKATNKWQRVTVCNYDTYQDTLNGKQQTNNKQATNNQQQLKNKRNKRTKEDIYSFEFSSQIPRVQKLEKPLTQEEYNKLLSEYRQEDVHDVLLAMENSNALKKYRSANLTARNWLKRNGISDRNEHKQSKFGSGGANRSREVL